MNQIDKVASAMREAYGVRTGEAIVPWAEASRTAKAHWRACARAAIKVLGA